LRVSWLFGIVFPNPLACDIAIESHSIAPGRRRQLAEPQCTKLDDEAKSDQRFAAKSFGLGTASYFAPTLWRVSRLLLIFELLIFGGLRIGYHRFKRHETHF
jgi:hypothetical protein